MLTLILDTRTVKTSSYRLACAYVRNGLAAGLPVAIIIAKQIIDINTLQDFIDLIDLANL